MNARAIACGLVLAALVPCPANAALREAYARIAPSLVLMHYRTGSIDPLGTGVVVASDSGGSYVLTANSLARADPVTVSVGPRYDGEIPATLVAVGGDAHIPATELDMFKLYRIPATGLISATFGTGRLGFRRFGAAGFATSTEAFASRRLTTRPVPKLIEATPSMEFGIDAQAARGFARFETYAGFGGGGAVVFDASDGTVRAVLQAVPIMGSVAQIGGETADILALFSAAAGVALQRAASVPTTVEVDPHERLAGSTVCLEQHIAADRTGKPADVFAGQAVVVGTDATRSYLLMIAENGNRRAVLSAGYRDPGRGTTTFFPATFVGIDAPTDLAVLAVPAKFPALPLDDAAASEPVIATDFRTFLGGSRCAAYPYEFFSGIVNASVAGVVEHSAGTTAFGYQAGFPIASVETVALLGVTFDYRAESNGTFRAYGAARIAAFLERLHVPFTRARASYAASPGFARALRAIVRVAGTETGTGFATSCSGTSCDIITAAHVVRGNRFVRVTRAGSERGAAATVVRRDERADLALLRVTGLALEPLSIAPGAEIAQRAATIGFPFATTGAAATPHVATGIVSTLLQGQDFFEHTAVTDPGNSGGPVFDPDDGTVLGLVHGALNERASDLRAGMIRKSTFLAVGAVPLRHFLGQDGVTTRRPP